MAVCECVDAAMGVCAHVCEFVYGYACLCMGGFVRALLHACVRALQDACVVNCRRIDMGCACMRVGVDAYVWVYVGAVSMHACV